MKLVDNYMNIASSLLERSAKLSIQELKYSPKIVFDVGACVGLYSLYISQMAPNATIHAFEPIKESFDIFKQNIELNKIKNIVANNIGLSDFTGSINMGLPKDRPKHKLDKTGKPGLGVYSSFWVKDNYDVVKTNITTLDNYMNVTKIDFIDILKMDCEGHELNIITSCLLILKNKVNLIFIEMNNVFGSVEKIKEILSELGFSMTQKINIDEIWKNQKFNKGRQ